jgi:hypothetical protein
MARLSAFQLLPPLCGALACAGSDDASSPSLRVIDPPLLVREVELARPFSSERDEMGFAMASAVGFHRDRLVVLETANDRLVLFDKRQEPVAYIGRAGAGPGELRGAIDLAVWQDEYAVAEINNTRVSVFSADGQFLRSFAVPNGFTPIEYGPDGTIYVNAYDGRNYLLAADRNGTLRPFGERPWDLYPDQFLEAPASQAGGRFFLAVTHSGIVYVYDHILGALVALDPAGRRIGVQRLPGRIVEGLMQKTRAVRKDFGGDGRGATADITDLALADDGRLLLLFPNVGAIGLLVDPADSSAQEIRWGPGLDPRFGGFSGLVRGDTLYRLSSDNLRLFRLAPE